MQPQSGTSAPSGILTLDELMRARAANAEAQRRIQQQAQGRQQQTPLARLQQQATIGAASGALLRPQAMNPAQVQQRTPQVSQPPMAPRVTQQPPPILRQPQQPQPQPTPRGNPAYGNPETWAPGASADDDAAWANKFQRTYGRAPSEYDWQYRWHHAAGTAGYGGEQPTAEQRAVLEAIYMIGQLQAQQAAQSAQPLYAAPTPRRSANTVAPASMTPAEAEITAQVLDLVQQAARQRSTQPAQPSQTYASPRQAPASPLNTSQAPAPTTYSSTADADGDSLSNKARALLDARSKPYYLTDRLNMLDPDTLALAKSIRPGGPNGQGDPYNIPLVYRVRALLDARKPGEVFNAIMRILDYPMDFVIAQPNIYSGKPTTPAEFWPALERLGFPKDKRIQLADPTPGNTFR